MTGTGRRRKPDPEEGATPAATPAPPAPTDKPEYEYAYDWRQAPAAPTPQPGPVFDPFIADPGSSAAGGSVFNPLGFGLQDPYAPATPAPNPPLPAPPTYPAPPRPATNPGPFPRQAEVPHQPSATVGMPRPAGDAGGLFDEDDLFATAAPPAVEIASDESDPLRPAPADGDPPPRDGYTAADFAFLDEETNQKDVNNWLTFAESRADSRAERSRRLRFRLIGAATAIALVAVGIGAYQLLYGEAFGTSAPTKSVIMLQVSNSTGNAVADALLVADRAAATSAGAARSAAGQGAAVLIPSRMLVNTTGFGPQPFGGRMADSIPAAGKDTVADILGVTIDGVWRMDETTFSGLIDEIGGIQLTADLAIPASTASPTAADAAVGPQKLTGAQAVAYGTYTAPGESATAQVKRFGDVIKGLLSALPSNATSITAYLNHLGIVDDPSLPETKLSPILAALATEQQAGVFTIRPLPLRTDGSDELDYQAAAPIVSSLLGGAVKAGSAAGQISRVLVEDGSGHTGIQSSAIRNAAQARLANGGYTYIDGSTVGRRATSVVEVASSDQHDNAVQIAETLGLPANDVQVVPGMATIADVTVILGADWPKLSALSLPTATAAAVGAP